MAYAVKIRFRAGKTWQETVLPNRYAREADAKRALQALRAIGALPVGIVTTR